MLEYIQKTFWISYYWFIFPSLSRFVFPCISRFMWHPTSLENIDVLIYINAPFLTQCVLKLWWPWTYQNSTVKRTFARVEPGWVTSWEVWIRGAKSEQYCVIGGGSLQMVLEPFPSLRWGSVHKPMRVTSGHSLGLQEWGDPMRVANGDVGS
jgi:hypothetical protein